MKKIEKARIRQQLIDSIVKNKKELTILVSTEDFSFRLSPEANTAIKKDKAGNSTTTFLEEVLYHGFTIECMNAQREELCYNWICEVVQNDLGSEINIVHGDSAAYIQLPFKSTSHIPGKVQICYLSIVATDELLGIVRNGKVPVMETKGDIRKLPNIWQSVKDTTGIRTEVTTNTIIFKHEAEYKEFRCPISLRGNQLRFGFFEKLTVVSDTMFKTGNAEINLKDAYIEYFFDEYDNVLRGEVVKVCNASEWRKLRIEELDLSACQSLPKDEHMLV